MLTGKKASKYADVLLWGLNKARKKKFKKNEVILLRFHWAAVRLAEVLQARLLELGMHTVIRPLLTPTMEHNFYSKANESQLVFLGPWEKELYSRLSGSIFLHAPESLTHLADVDSKRIGRAAVAAKPLRDIVRDKEAGGNFGWTLCAYPTEELAKQAKLSVKQYENQIIRACYLDKQDPVKVWEEIYNQAMEIKRWLNRMDVKYFHVESENIDLKIRPGRQRRWVGISGHNIPSFELFLSPDWRGTQGIYYSNQPSFRNGNYVEGVRLVFEKGKAVHIHAEKGKRFTVDQLAMDKGASRVGEFSLTDKRFSRINRFMANTLYDENFGGKYGNCHLAVGASYDETYAGDTSKLTKAMKSRLGFNDSALHWDLVNTEKKDVTAYLRNGKSKIIYQNGAFKY